MHTTAYGFASTGAKNFFGRNGDISDRLVLERKYFGKAFDMSSKNADTQPVENEACKVSEITPSLQPDVHDILLGRGGKNNRHSGNEKLRELARVQATKYNASTKKGKSILSRLLVKQMRELDPSARYVILESVRS